MVPEGLKGVALHPQVCRQVSLGSRDRDSRELSPSRSRAAGAPRRTVAPLCAAPSAEGRNLSGVQAGSKPQSIGIDGGIPKIRSDSRYWTLSGAPDKVHSRRKFFELADVASKARDKTSVVICPMAFQAVQKFDAIFALERSINGLPPNERLAPRRRDIAPSVKDLVDWMTRERAKLSRHNDVAKAMDYMLTRLEDFRRFLEDGRITATSQRQEPVRRCQGQPP
jgi:Transposase IS66 family